MRKFHYFGIGGSRKESLKKMYLTVQFAVLFTVQYFLGSMLFEEKIKSNENECFCHKKIPQYVHPYFF